MVWPAFRSLSKGSTKKASEERRNLRALRGLHIAGKYKRILTRCDFWFGKTSLPRDRFVLRELARHGGYIPLATLARFPKFQYWAEDTALLEGALKTAKRYDAVPKSCLNFDTPRLNFYFLTVASCVRS